jgi:hypothetical protein
MHVDLMRDKSTIMPVVDGRVHQLRIWHCKYKTLRPIKELLNLRVLVIATYPDDSLEPLLPLVNLRCLSILHLPKIRDLSAFANLRQLETLDLQTLPSWDASGRVTEVESLEPIAALPALKHLSLYGVVPKTRSLAPLVGCPNLKSARFSKYPLEKVERFYASTKVMNARIPKPVSP